VVNPVDVYRPSRYDSVIKLRRRLDMSTEAETDQTVKKIIAELENNVSVLSWLKENQNDEEAQKHIKAIKDALSKAKTDLIKA
jgi:thiamine monophosphate synthase